jgi:hypothetical protein
MHIICSVLLALSPPEAAASIPRASKRSRHPDFTIEIDGIVGFVGLAIMGNHLPSFAPNCLPRGV